MATIERILIDPISADEEPSAASLPLACPSDPSDAHLIAQIAQRDELALGCLYNRYSRLVYTVALRITQNQSSAEEVVQDVFSAVWRSAQHFQRDGNVKAWLNGITRHRAIDTTRVQHFRAHADQLRLDAFRSLTIPIEVEMQVIDVLECERLWQSVASLSPAQRSTIELAYHRGLSPREIAASTGVPLGTVKTRLRLGLVNLRALLSLEAATVVECL